MSCHQLILVLGDQLDRESAALAACGKDRDVVLMIEARAESQRIQSHQVRTTLFLSAMRHHAVWLEAQGYKVDYVRIDRPEAASFATALTAAIERHAPQRLLMVEAGEYAVQQQIDVACRDAGLALKCLVDSHFLCSRDEFAAWRKGRKSLLMEHFYRHMRKRHGILIEDGQPTGGKWNFDQKNRKSFGRRGPDELPAPPHFAPDGITQGVRSEVARHFPDNPGHDAEFGWPVTREQALEMLRDFVDQRLARFGPYEDAMWQDEPILYNSGLSAALNLKLLNPREVIDAALAAHAQQRAPRGREVVLARLRLLTAGPRLVQ